MQEVNAYMILDLIFSVYILENKLMIIIMIIIICIENQTFLLMLKTVTHFS